jgi:O-Antigen ligase
MTGVKAAAVSVALIAALGAVQGGFQADAWVWSGALAAWIAAVALIAGRDAGIVRTAWPWLAAVGALLAWTALSALWSTRPGQSLLEARRTLVYAAVVLALATLARRGSARPLALGTFAGAAGLVLYALCRYLLSPRRRDPVELHLISQPLGYANAVGILAVLAVLLGLGIAGTESGRVTLLAAAVPPLLLALTLSGSTASWLALGVGIAVTAALAAEPERYLLGLAAVAAPNAALVVLGRYSRFAADVPSARVGGIALATAALAGALLAALTIRVQPRLPSARRLRTALLVLLLALAAGGLIGVAHAGSTEPRSAYWHVAWRDFTAHPALGSGAGTFGAAWNRSGNVVEFGGALDAHSLYLETLAELGPVGLALVLVVLLVPLGAALRNRPLAAAAAGAYCAFLVHVGLDWDWELPAVIVAGLGCGAAILAAAAPPGEGAPLSKPARAALVSAAVVLAGCAIAGARSHAAPSAEKARAPTNGALAKQTAVSRRGYVP